ncbi:SDR family NAD(P)-dependent oxidoreductase [Maridesulfovibrio hydrothermalis]|uniref:Putative MaoC domain protein dehydratase n=1 Tax=Maridesulfovibrio hydrothermalis AM13 = DSM 14728 TaxID=1121451 RepID=L0RAG0_9BACT|nr:SDR family NAD(P)-dependent oxidoreductase [Maridesulfovibrio hydrothermalis]CCO23202.1 putative MaoC domain protein dehydratase [Maridesulfovibrio hydrothermalis AM13 = DSM 14728]
MATKIFSLDDQLSFADLSGDFNPFHVDPLKSRRFVGGAPAVHGVNALLWAMENSIPAAHNLSLKSVNALFHAPLHIDTEATLVLKESDAPMTVDMSIISEGTIKTQATITYTQNELKTNFEISHKNGTGFCLERSPESLLGTSGSISLFCRPEAVSRLYPALCKAIPLAQISLLISTSRTVGMDCPGLHSIFSELDIDFTVAAQNNESTYFVKKFDKRFNLVLLDVATPVGSGVLTVFLRPEPQKQLLAKSALKIVPESFFADTKSLVIGGSRGIGEVTAKLIAAGDSEVTITYSEGKEDAEKVAQDIISAGGSANIIQFDVLSSRIPSQIQCTDFTHLFYFASPYIFNGKSGFFSKKLYAQFSDFYVHSFLNLFVQLNKDKLKMVFNPSTIAVEEPEPDMGEYITAKAAMEGLCAYLGRVHRKINFAYPRLPRTATDQTASVYPIKSNDPVEVMLKYLIP